MMQKMKDKQKVFAIHTIQSSPFLGTLIYQLIIYTLLQWVYSEKKLFNKSYHVVKVFSVFKNSFQEMLMMIYLDGVR